MGRRARWLPSLAFFAGGRVRAAAGAARAAMTLGSPARPGWRISQVLAGATVGRLWAGSPGCLAGGDECADRATCGSSNQQRHPRRAALGRQGVAGGHAATGVCRQPARPGRRRGGGHLRRRRLGLAGAAPIRWTQRPAAPDQRRMGRPGPARSAIQSAIAPSPRSCGRSANVLVGRLVTSRTSAAECRHTGVPLQRHRGGRPLRERRLGWRRRDGTAGLAIEHWNGHRWLATPLPHLGLAASDLRWSILGLADVGWREVWPTSMMTYTGAKLRARRAALERQGSSGVPSPTWDSPLRRCV